MEFSPEAASFEIPVGLNTIERSVAGNELERAHSNLPNVEDDDDEMARAIALSLQEAEAMNDEIYL